MNATKPEANDAIERKRRNLEIFMPTDASTTSGDENGLLKRIFCRRTVAIHGRRQASQPLPKRRPLPLCCIPWFVRIWGGARSIRHLEVQDTVLVINEYRRPM